MKKILTVNTEKLTAIFVSSLTNMALWQMPCMLIYYNDWFYICKNLMEGEINYNYSYWITFNFSFSFFEIFPSEFVFCNLIHIYNSCIFSSSFLLFLVLLFCIYGNMFHSISLLATIVNFCLFICHLFSCINLLQNILLTECNSGRTQKLPFGANTEIGLKNITTTSGKTSTLVS